MRKIPTLCALLALLAACEASPAAGGADVGVDAGADAGSGAAADAEGRSGDAEVPPCVDVVVPPAPGVCVGNGTDLSNERYAGLERTIVGTVSATGVGIPDDDPPPPRGGPPRHVCWHGGARVGFGHDLPGYTRTWFRVDEADGGAWTVGVQVPGGESPFFVREGEAVRVTVRDLDNVFSQDVAAVAIERSDGALLLWFGEGGETADLEPPGLTVRPGAPLCADASECGAWRLHHLELEADGERFVLPYGGALDMAGRRVVHAGAAWETSRGQCPDWGVGQVALLVTPGPCDPPCEDERRCLEGVCRETPPACGHPSPASPDCRAAVGADACEAAGGTWRSTDGSRTYGWCACPSGDGGCPCWRDSHCQGRCESDVWPCGDGEIGTCSADLAFTELGCHCLADPFDDTPGFAVLCAD